MLVRQSKIIVHEGGKLHVELLRLDGNFAPLNFTIEKARYFLKLITRLTLNYWSSVKSRFLHWRYPNYHTTICLLAHLACMPMSLCNHDLSIVCRWYCHYRHCHWCCLCTVVPVTGLIIETSYLADICKNTHNVRTWNIGSVWHIFFEMAAILVNFLMWLSYLHD